MEQLEKQRVCVKFCFKLEKTFVETFESLKQVYGEECMSRKQCYEWFRSFKEGRTSVIEDLRLGRPYTSTDDRHYERVREVIRGNRRLIVREATEETGISVESCHAILTRKLQMHHVSTTFFPHLLTDGQQENRISISQYKLANADADENFLQSRLGSSQLFSISQLKTILKSHHF